MGEISDRLQAVLDRIAAAAHRAGRDPASITLVAVSKRQEAEKVIEAYEAGQRDFGENYAQALEERHGALPDDIRWHFVGHLQRNKAKKVGFAHLIHTVDSVKLGQALAKAAQSEGRTIPILVQVNVSGEESKSGLAPGDARAALDELRQLAGLEVRGLMCIPAKAPASRVAFAGLRVLRDRLAAECDHPLPELSMGMSDDFEDAILEGATIVRVGTLIFGERPPEVE